MFPTNYIKCANRTKEYLININTKIIVYLINQGSGFSKNVLDDAKLICYNSKIYVQNNLLRRVLDWYYLNINHLDSSRLANTTREV